MDTTLIANMDNAIAKNEFLLSQKQITSELYYEPDSPLNNAQVMSDALRMRQQRKPMVLEYYKEKGVLESIEMYINPENLQFSAAKVNNKTYTRGGIFYHHWGEDSPTLQISGNVGLSMMKGIEQLEKIYYYSGVLLRYKTAGVEVVNNGNQEDYEVIDYNSPYGALEYISSTNLDSDRISSIKQSAKNYADNNYINNKYSTSDLKNCDIADYIIDNYSYASQLNKDNVKINEVYLSLLSFKEDKEASLGYCDFNTLLQYSNLLCKKEFSSYAEDIQENLAFDLATNLSSNSNIKSNISSTYRDVCNNKLERMSEQLVAVQNYNENTKISMDEIMPGIADINDELTDEWRPRLIFIYFEDRVYIGHFDNFNWSRNAQTPLITYNMKFTINRQLLMTSTSTNREKPSTTYPITKPEVDSSYNRDEEENDSINAKLEKIREEAKVGKIDTAVEYILQIKGEWRNKDDLNRTKNGTGVSDEQAQAYKELIYKIHDATRYNGVNLIYLPNRLLDDNMYVADVYLDYFEYCLERDYTFIKPIIVSECKRIRSIVEAEYKTWQKARKEQVVGWIKKIFLAVNGRQYYYEDLDYVIRLLKITI